MAFFQNIATMDEAALDKRQTLLAPFRKAERVFRNPLFFFGLLAAGLGASVLLPGVPFLMLLVLGSAAGVRYANGFLAQKSFDVDKLRVHRMEEKVQGERAALLAAEAGPAPGLQQTPDLGKAFGQGLERSVSVKPLRLSLRSPSSTLSA